MSKQTDLVDISQDGVPSAFKPTYIGGATYVVTVASVGGVNKFHIAGVANPTLSFLKGNAYVFDLSDSSNAGHPLVFKTSGGSAYTTGVVVTGTAGQAGANVTITVAASAPAALLYACSVHGDAMGNTIAVAAGGVLNIGTFNYFDNGTLAANTTVSFASVPTTAQWKYSFTPSNIATPYDLANTSTSNTVNFSVSSQDTSPRGLFFKPDGLKFYHIGQVGDSVYEYNLSTAWDLTTGSYVRAFSVSSYDAKPEDVSFKTDGTEMYIVGQDGNDVFQYTLSTAWNISTASYTTTKVVNSQDTKPNSVTFKTDGTKMYVGGQSSTSVLEYTLSTAWLVSTASYTQNFVTSSSNEAIELSSDGTKMFVSDGNNIKAYSLSTAWNVTTASLTSTTNIGIGALGIAFKSDGLILFITEQTNDQVKAYPLVDLTTVTLPSAVVETVPAISSIRKTTYAFTTLNGGTTVNLIDETPQSTDAGAIGTYTFGRPANLIDYSMGATATGIVPTSNSTGSAPYYNASGWNNYHAGAELSGTWRCMSEAYSTGTLSWSGLWVRIS